MRTRQPFWLLFGTALTVSFAAIASACGGGSSDAARPTTGKGIYQAYCATCHGKNGQGFVGPSLIGVADEYPDIEDQIAIVANGRNRMPSWRGQLTPQEIRKVVDYTRTELGSNGS